MIKVTITNDAFIMTELINSSTPLELISLASLSKQLDDSSWIYLPSNDQKITKTIKKDSITFEWFCWLNMCHCTVELTCESNRPHVDLAGDDTMLSIVEKSE